jgi:AraC family mar-sox-rob regulon transcriptional activator
MTTSDKIREHLQTADLRRALRPNVAKALHISDTTLARYLRQEGVSYQQLLDAERKRRTDECLATWGNQAYGKRISDVCGYTKLNSFYRAFRRWTGTDYLQARMSA